jgi:hypothetical protein
MERKIRRRLKESSTVRAGWLALGAGVKIFEWRGQYAMTTTQ